MQCRDIVCCLTKLRSVLAPTNTALGDNEKGLHEVKSNWKQKCNLVIIVGIRAESIGIEVVAITPCESMEGLTVSMTVSE